MKPIGQARVCFMPIGKIVEIPCELLTPIPCTISGDKLRTQINNGERSELNLDIYFNEILIAKIYDILSYIRGMSLNHIGIPEQIIIQRIGLLNYTPLHSAQNIVMRMREEENESSNLKVEELP
ncbi:MAG: hypothetical protein [brine shrimp arlivirus 2]|nr:MAG: hypothetical protein [brine shrimp arlivirus 2]